MDFGSVGLARPVFENRKQALAMQEFCEEACSVKKEEKRRRREEAGEEMWIVPLAASRNPK
jgi:hypothetical protein